MSNASNMNSHCDPVISNLRVAGSIPAAPTRFKGLQPNLADNIAVAREFSAEKLPVTHKPDDYLRAQIRFLLLNIDQIKRYQGHLRGAVQDRLRDLARELRNSKGFCDWRAIAVGMAFMAGFIYLAYYFRPTLIVWQYPADEVRVLSRYSDFNFQLQQVHEGVPQIPTVFHFDPNESRPQFEIGETLSQLIWEQKGEYQSLGARPTPYKIERDSFGWPKLAGNCVNLGVKQPVICDGKPKWEEK